jgi:isoleucyl-tRNA synthetase
MAVMKTCFDAITRLLAPILVFTADEAWEFAGNSGSVHLEKFPEAAGRDEALERQLDEWLKLRGVVYQQAIEPARQAKTISKSLEATVTLETPATLEGDRGELEEFFIISEIQVVAGGEARATLTKSSHASCARCWRYLPSVGLDSSHPDLCDRCAAAVQTCVPA